MSLPITYVTWKEWQDLCHTITSAPDRHICYEARDAIERSANWLIERLYVPCTLDRHSWGTVRAKTTNRLTHPFDVEEEPINWGDLSASVEQRGDMFIVTLEEASPGECPELCSYVAFWLAAWGWQNIEVRSAW